jgi:hypothetical protein
MTTTWKIAQLDRQTSDGLVTIAHWRVDAVDGDYSAGSYGAVGFELDVEAIETSLAAQIEAKKNPTTAVGVPW